MTRMIDYGDLMQRAMREMVRSVLRDVEKDGLPGDHHFFITFDTTHPGAKIPDWLGDRYPNDMTVVLQHWFDRLEVSGTGFSVTLKFGGKPEHLHIPIDAITAFADPSVEFGLRFQPRPGAGEVAEAPMDSAPAEAERRDAEIVSLDSFRGPRG